MCSYEAQTRECIHLRSQGERQLGIEMKGLTVWLDSVRPCLLLTPVHLPAAALGMHLGQTAVILTNLAFVPECVRLGIFVVTFLSLAMNTPHCSVAQY